MDRGFGRCQVMRKYTTVIKKYPNNNYDRIVRPIVEEGSPDYEKYEALDVDGIARVGEKLKNEQVFINKQTPVETTNPVNGSAPSLTNSNPWKNAAMALKYPDDVVVDSVKKSFKKALLLFIFIKIGYLL